MEELGNREFSGDVRVRRPHLEPPAINRGATSQEPRAVLTVLLRCYRLSEDGT